MADIQVPQVPDMSSDDINSAFNQASVPQQAIPDPIEAPQQASQTSGPVNVINPEGKLVSIDALHLPQALRTGYREASHDDVHKFEHAEKYGSADQTSAALLEGAASAATFGLSTGLQRLMGEPAEDIQGRREENPIAREVVGPILGLVGSAVAAPVLGATALMGKAGAAVAGALGLGAKGAGFISQVGAGALKGAVENGIMQAGEEASKYLSDDPNQHMDTAISDMGMATVLGGVFGGPIAAAAHGLGAAKSAALAKLGAKIESTGDFISQADRAAFEAGDLAATVENSSQFKGDKDSILKGLKQMAPDAEETIAAAKRIGIDIVPEEMTTGSEAVKKAGSSLLHGDIPSFSGEKRRALYDGVYNKANAVVKSVAGEGEALSKAEMGNVGKEMLTNRIEEANKPMQQMYEALRKDTDMVPASSEAVSSLKNSFEKELGESVRSNTGGNSFLKNVIKDLDRIKTVDDIKVFNTSLYEDLPATASRGERNMAARISDGLKKLEEESIEHFKGSIPPSDARFPMLQELGERIKGAREAYKPFINDVKELARIMGKKNIGGAQEAAHFLEGLDPEKITDKLFNKRSSESIALLQKKFPELMDQVRNYQKGVMREAATKGGEFSEKTFFNQVNKLEPEIQKAIFSPEELSRLKDAEHVLRKIPKDYNPSGTAHMGAFRELFTSPMKAFSGNARDYGIEKFIKYFGDNSELRNAHALGKAIGQGEKRTNQAAEAVFKGKGGDVKVPTEADRKKLSKLVDDHTANPEKMLEIGANNPVHQYATAMAASAARVVQYLASQKPSSTPKSPLDPKPVPSPTQQAAYQRALNIAQSPLLALKMVKDGTLTSTDLVHLKAMYPTLYTRYAEKLSDQMIEAQTKGKTIPFATKQSLSLFMGQPMDSSFKPEAILAAQPKPAQGPQNQDPSQPHQKGSPSAPALQKMSKMSQTPDQAREAHRQK